LQLQQVRLLPAGQNALKNRPLASAEQRRAMLDIAIAPYPTLCVDDRELRREGISYSIDSCREIRAELGADTCIGFVVGSDILPELHRWRDWRQLLDVVNLVVMQRAADPSTAPGAKLDSEVETLLAGAVTRLDRPRGQVVTVELAAYAVSSSYLRAQLCARSNMPLDAKPGSSRWPAVLARLRSRLKGGCRREEASTLPWQQLLPAGVLQYIDRHGLYHGAE